MNGKRTLLETLARRERIPLERCAYIGDSDNDRWVFDAAGLAIAFQPKTHRIRRHADVVVEDDSLTATLPYLL
jgi:phosphoserine phosphatase